VAFVGSALALATRICSDLTSQLVSGFTNGPQTYMWRRCQKFWRDRIEGMLEGLLFINYHTQSKNLTLLWAADPTEVSNFITVTASNYTCTSFRSLLYMGPWMFYIAWSASEIRTREVSVWMSWDCPLFRYTCTANACIRGGEFELGYAISRNPSEHLQWTSPLNIYLSL